MDTTSRDRSYFSPVSLRASYPLLPLLLAARVSAAKAATTKSHAYRELVDEHGDDKDARVLGAGGRARQGQARGLQDVAH
jgi:hypothetical protein